MRSSRYAPPRTGLLLVGAILLACGASASHAQGRRRGGSPADPSAPSRPSVAPVLWEPEQVFPLAIAHAADLHLTDDQRTQIEMIGSQLRADNTRLLAQIDTLRPPPPESGDASSASAAPPPRPTSEEIAAVVARRHALGEARAQLHDNTRLAREHLMALLTPAQQTRLAADEQAARTAAERGDPGGSDGGRGGRHGGGKVGPS